MISVSSILESAYPAKCSPHRANLIQKERRVSTDLQCQLFEQVITSYRVYIGELEKYNRGESTMTELVQSLNIYLDICKATERADSMFNWRSDFAGSVIPELLHKLIYLDLKSAGLDPQFSSGDAVVELTLAGGGGGWNVRHKKQDLCLGFESIKLNIAGGRTEDIVVPVLVTEVKTNLDINKLSGLNYSAESLKRTFPQAKYFIATETVDFSLSDNYVSGGVDEIYVLRKQVRSEARRSLRQLVPDVFEEFILDVVSFAKKATLTRGHVYSRLPSGKLISESTV